MCEAGHTSRLKGYWVWSHGLFNFFFFFPILLTLFKWLWTTYQATVTSHLCNCFIFLMESSNPPTEVQTGSKTPDLAIFTSTNRIMQPQVSLGTVFSEVLYYAFFLTFITFSHFTFTTRNPRGCETDLMSLDKLTFGSTT